MNRPSSKKTSVDRIQLVLLINIFIVCICIAFVIIEWHIGYRIQCPIHQHFEVNCPDCGTTRLIESVLYDHDLYQAFRWNPYVFIMWPIVILVYLYQNIFYVFRGKWSKFTIWFIGIFLSTLIIFGIVRNFPCLMFLSPTQLLDSVQ